MARKKVLVLIPLLAMVFALTQIGKTHAVSPVKALDAAKKWLALVDSGEYLKSWETAAGYFKAAVSEKQWEQTLTAVRGPLGKVISRKLKSKQYTETLPGAPDGKYVVIQFETSFEKKKSSIETITPMKDKDGIWRVSGYYIK